jgi:ABC-type branched-subunit amino acid transport system permease subunit
MGAHIKDGLRAGLVFGVIILFLSLIGFNSTMVLLLGSVLGNVSNLTRITGGAIVNYLIILVLLGIWMGSQAVKHASSSAPIRESVLSGLFSGVAAGLMCAVYGSVIGAVQAQGADLRAYLAALAPEAVKLFLFGLPALAAAGIYLTVLGASGMLGSLLSLALKRRRDTRAHERRGLRSRIESLPIVQKFLSSQYRNWILYAILLVIVVLVPLPLSDYWNYTLGTVGIYVLLGLGLNVVVGMAGLLDLGYVAFFAIGAYTVALLTAPEPHNLLWSFFAALPFGVVLAALAGILLGIPVLRMRGDYLAIVTLGFGEIIRILSKSDVLTDFSGGPRGVRAIATPRLFGLNLGSDIAFIYLIVIGCLVAIFVTSRLANSRVGRAWVAMREDETVAQAMGINTWQYKLMAFAIGAAFAGLGGVLFASRNQFTGPEDHNLMVSINVLSLVIVGGMGSIPGVIAGSLALKGLPELLRQLEVFRMLAFGALLVTMMILRPEGLWPSQRRRLEMHRESEPEPDEAAILTGGEAE